MIKQECIGIPDMILLLMIFCFKKIKIKAEIVLSPGGAYFINVMMRVISFSSCDVLMKDIDPNYNSNFHISRLEKGMKSILSSLV